MSNKINGAEALIRSLINEGVDTISSTIIPHS